MGEVDDSFMQRLAEKYAEAMQVRSLGRGPQDPQIPDMNERIARLEGAFEQSVEANRHSQNMLLGLVGIGFAIVIALLVYVLQRIDNLPADFERITQTISSAITATRQQAPQVIMMAPPMQSASPQPSLQPPQQEPRRP